LPECNAAADYAEFLKKFVKQNKGVTSEKTRHFARGRVGMNKRSRTLIAFPDALRRAMRESKVSQSELARRVKCNRSDISAYLRGLSVPRRERLQRINEALGVDLYAVKPITAKEVAQRLGMCVGTLLDGLEDPNSGLSRIGGIVRTNKKRKPYFFPAAVERLLGLADGEVSAQIHHAEVVQTAIKHDTEADAPIAHIDRAEDAMTVRHLTAFLKLNLESRKKAHEYVKHLYTLPKNRAK